MWRQDQGMPSDRGCSMMENVQNQPDRNSYTAPPRPRRYNLSYLGAALLTLTVLTGGYFALQNTATVPVSDRGDAEEQGDPPAAPVHQQFRKWERPELAIVLSGEMHGYIHPCGC